jgi:hypothetical protein
VNWLDDPAQFEIWKTNVVDYTGLAKDAMHVHIGLAVFILVRVLWRWRGGWILAWLAALAAALAGEYLDLKGETLANTIRPDLEHWHDVWNTMLWPTVLLLIGRWLHPRSKILVAPPKSVETEASSSDCADDVLEKPPTV